MSEGHDDHDHNHGAESPALRAEALELLLREAGLVTEEQIDLQVLRYEEDIGPMRGAQVVAHAWLDPEFKSRLLADGSATIDELGFQGAQAEHLVVKENSETVHNVIVCTLCSCYPWAVLGLPPTWYKDPAYRSRVVREPRKVLEEMGLSLAGSVEIRVWDSTAEVRYMVLPQRPAETEGLSEAELAALVARSAMIGVGVVEKAEEGG